MTRTGSRLDRRDILKALALAGPAVAGIAKPAHAAGALNMQTWSAAVDTVKAHLAAFEQERGLHVDFGTAPFAQYRESMIAKFVGGAPLDVMWVSDSWLPEWVEAGWIAPVDGYDFLTKYNAEAEPFCTDSMTYKGHQYGLTYYTDYMAFLYDESKLKAAGFDKPPETWEELVAQSTAMKTKKIAEFPLMLAMAQESWQIEFISTLVFSHGGRLVDAKGDAVMQQPREGALAALKWLVDAVNKHKIVSPACVETGELAGLKAFSSGSHAFALIAKYRLRTLNDPAQSAVAGKIKQALVPKGPDGKHETVGWMRFHGLASQAVKDKTRAENAARLIEWFGGKAGDRYAFQKALFLDIGAGFGQPSLFQDDQIRKVYSEFADVEMVKAQQALARKKDVVTPWFGEWNETNGAAWQSALLGKITPEAALDESAKAWNKLKSRA